LVKDKEAVMDQIIDSGRRSFLSQSLLAAAAACGAAPAAFAIDTNSPEEDLQVVQGVWERKVPPEAYGDFRRAVKDVHGSQETVTYYDDGGAVVRTHQVDFKLERRGEVKIFTYFNWEAVAGPQKGLKVPAPTSYIYRADDIAFVEVWGFLRGQEQRAPRLMIWVKGPPESEDARKQLQGTWAVQSQEDGAKPFADLKGAQITFSGGDFTIRRENRPILAGVFRTDPSKDPKTIELVITESINDHDNAKAMHGIYEVKEDELRWCTTPPGITEHLSAFTIRPGSAQTLIVAHHANP
jgi:uncharacterized protein (TIGR03067 family)